jgi:hypothetical protein
MDVQYLFLEEITVPENLSTLIQDQFGNYVIQNALKYLPVELRGRFIETLYRFMDLIKQMPWGLQIISKMCSDSSLPHALVTPVIMSSPADLTHTYTLSSPSSGL